MHELPITESILEIALRHGKKNNAARISAIHLVIGQLSSFIDESIQFYWGIVAEDTIAQGARLNIRRVQAQMQCTDCLIQFTPSSRNFACPACESVRVKVIAGDEFYLESIEIDK
ncbi:MAG: hydrogenase maturation nickel metallochaperone HypA [Chloroflexi bacterium]|nr:MAG: hydrogenase maturation nickel metallochaperone HypA [Chloroflexota bacterium]